MRLSRLKKTRKSATRERLSAMLENMPLAVMTCDLQTFEIDYVNPATVEGLKGIQHLLPCKAEDIVGQSIDIFHKKPEYQRALLTDPQNLPHRARIELGEEVLDLNISAIYDHGRYVGPMLTWSVITDQVRAERESYQLLQMLDDMPLNVMMVDRESLEITYLNKTSTGTLRPLQHLLPASVDELKGQCIDIFHKNPAHQRAILADPARLPFNSKIKLGDETLDLKVSAIRDKDGSYMAPMLNWSVVTDQVALANDLETAAERLAHAANGMNERSTSLAAASEQTSKQSSTVATAIEELSTSISEISHQLTKSAEISRKAVEEANNADQILAGMAEAASTVGNVIQLIQDIADQTNLLALNATIEAARAGDAGKGFAVVASEVKGLAGQTAKATNEISIQIEQIQSAATASVAGVKKITEIINNMAESSATISAAVEEQSVATNEAAQNITGVSEAAGETGRISNEFRVDATGLADDASALQQTVDTFLSNG